LPERKHRRASPWVVVPTLLITLLAVFAAIVYLQHRQRFVATAGMIVYASDKGSPGTSHLWIAQSDLINPHRITSGDASEESPAFSPTGSQIAFLSDRVKKEFQVFMMDADGQNLRQITDTSGAKSQPSFAPSSNTLLAYLAGGAVYAVDVESQVSGRLLPPAIDVNDPNAQNADAGTAPILQYAWSPTSNKDRQSIIGVQQTATAIGDAQAAMLLPTLDGKAAYCGAPGNPSTPVFADSATVGWSPDCGSIAMGVVGPLGAGKSEIPGLLIFNSQGTLVRIAAEVPSSTEGPQNPVFSPDGTQVLFELWMQPSLAQRHCVGLFISPADGSAPPRMVVRGWAEHAQFSADGNSILFLGQRPNGGHDLCKVDLDGTGGQRLSDGIEDVTSYVVSPQKNG
jgi:dipeptidyl aminopeptidase/acylaminoacyl peptidase